MDSAIFGRDAVLEEAWRSLSLPAAVLIEGPAGIGKTVVWRALLARARQRGWLVLSCAPTEAESALALAALADLLRPLAGAVPGLPPPQRAAAEAVLLSRDPDGALEERALGAATRSLLDGVLASDTPVLVAVDDAPWLDPPSERALRFALRRVTGPLAVLVARRSTEAENAPMPLGLERRGDTAPITLAPLGTGALHRVLRDRVGAPLGRALLGRVVREAAGNPLLAIELARAVRRLPRPPLPGDDLPIASSIQAVIAQAVATLPPPGHDAVRLAALLAVPSLRDLAAAGVAAEDFDAAEAAGVLTVVADAVEFAHPMYASAVRAAIPAGVRRRLHAALAAVVADPDERARQLARSAVEPHEATAAELVAAAQRQRARGAPEFAAQMYERAAELTPAVAAEDRHRRRLDAARCRFDSGDYTAARATVEAIADEVTGALRAEAFLLDAMVAWSVEDTSEAAVAAGEQALAAAPAGTPLAGRVHAHLSLFHDAPLAARAHARAACDLLTGSDADGRLLAASLLQLMFSEVRAGLPARTDLLDRALELEDGEPSWLAGTIPAIWWKAVDDHDRARVRLRWMLDYARARGDETWQHEILTHLGEAELLAGRFDAAREHITAARDLGEQLGMGDIAEIWLGGLLDAHCGRLGEAAACAESGLRRAEAGGDTWARRINLHLCGFAALCDGRAREAAAAYAELAGLVDAMSLVEPLSQRFEADWIEACVAAGDLGTAASALTRLEERHRRLPRPWTALGLARGRVLLECALGEDPVAALGDLVAALSGVPVDVVPLERARCLLVAGVAHRRARRKRQAREALTAAVERFTALGAAGFAHRARQELERVGGKPPAPRELSATEEQVARLAGLGKTNRAIAAALFVSPKTVEANLARVYHKLGISSRAELGAAMAERLVGKA